MNEDNKLFTIVSWLLSIFLMIFGIYIIFGSFHYVNNLFIVLFIVIFGVPLIPSLTSIIQGERIVKVNGTDHSVLNSLLIFYLYHFFDFVINLLFVLLTIVSVFIDLLTILILVFFALGIFSLIIWVIKFVFNIENISGGISRENFCFIVIFDVTLFILLFLSLAVIKPLRRKYDTNIISLIKRLYQYVNDWLKNTFNISTK